MLECGSLASKINMEQYFGKLQILMFQSSYSNETPILAFTCLKFNIEVGTSLRRGRLGSEASNWSKPIILP